MQDNHDFDQLSQRSNKASKGGNARKSNLTPEARREIARKAAKARWSKSQAQVDSNPTTTAANLLEEEIKLPVAAYSGYLEIPGSQIACHVLDNGQRIIGRKTANQMLTSVKGAGDLERTIGVRALKQFLDFDYVTSQFVEFRSTDTERLGNKSKGMPAEIFIDICRAFVDALSATYQGTLNPGLTDKQKEIAIRASSFLAAVAKVGLDALIDEATGYQEFREQDALQVKLKAYLAEEMRKWEKTFPDELWLEFGRLTGWNGSIHARPKYWGKLVMELVYEYLDSDVAQWLKDNAPKPRHGQNYHQWLNSQYGLQKLTHHIWQIIGMAKSCRDLSELRHQASMVFGTKPLQLTFEFYRQR